MTDDERAIRELLATWFDATKKGDTATVLSLMTDDVVFMVPGMRTSQQCKRNQLTMRPAYLDVALMSPSTKENPKAVLATCGSR
jgi:uncharacterized protein (TIGR02246 family)